jgi:hypothetical protein
LTGLPDTLRDLLAAVADVEDAGGLQTTVDLQLYDLVIEPVDPVERAVELVRNAL